MNYYNVLLRSIGFDSTQIGFWGSASSAIAMATLPLWGVVSDKIGSAKRLYLLSMILYAAIFAILPVAGNMAPATFIPLYALILSYSLVRQPTHSLQDAWMLGICVKHGLDFTSIRKWGSLGFAVISVFYGWIAAYIGTGFIFFATPVLVVPMALLCRRFPPGEPPVEPAAPVEKRVPKARINPLLLFKNYHYATSYIITIALAFYSALVMPFYPFILESAGMRPDQFGTVSGFGAFVQVAVMWSLSRYCRKIPLPAILVGGAAVGVLENVMYGLADNFGMLMAAGTLWGIEMAINVSTLPTYIYSLIPRSHTATAMSVNGAVVTLLTIIGNYAGGHMVARIGIDRYNYALALMRGGLTLLFVLTLLIGKKHTIKNTA